MKTWTPQKIESILRSGTPQPIHGEYKIPDRGRVILANCHTINGIAPKHVVVKGHLFNAFDNTETEVSASYIIDLCIKRGHWGPFSYNDIEKVYRKHHKDGFTFNRLIRPGTHYSITGTLLDGGGWIVKLGNKLFITEDFVNRCFASVSR